MQTEIPPELEVLTATQVAASFGRQRDWWSRVRVQYEEQLGFPRPIAPLVDRRKGGRASVPTLIYNKQAVIAWHKRQRGEGEAAEPPPANDRPNLAALDRALGGR